MTQADQVITIKVTTDVKTGGLLVTRDAIAELDRGVAKADKSVNTLGEAIQKRLSAKDVGMGILGGLGIGSVFGVINTVLGTASRYFAEHEAMLQKVDETWKGIVEKSRQYQRSLLNPDGQRQELRKELADTQADYLRLTQIHTYRIPSMFNPSTGQGGQTVEIKEPDRSPKNLQAIMDNLAKQAALAEQIASLDKAITDTEAKSSEDRAAAVVDEDEKIQAAQKQLHDTFDKSAEAYRRLADPQRQYQIQLAEIDRLMNTVSASGKPFLSAQEGAAAKARILAEMNDTSGKAIRAAREEVERYDFALANLDANPALSDQEKYRERIRLLDDQTAAINRAKEALTAFMQANPGVDTAAITSALQGLGDKGARNAGQAQPAQTLAQRDATAVRDLSDPSKHYQSLGEGVLGGLSQTTAEMGTAADQAANTIRNVLGSAVNGISDGIYGWVTGTMSWGESLRQIGGSILQSVLQSLVQIAVQELIIDRIRDAMVSRRQAKEKGELGTKAVGAGLESVKQLGPIFGPIAFAASLAAIIGIAGQIGGHASGGIVRGGRQLSWLNEEGQEAVIRAPSVRRFGTAFLSDLNEGVLNLDALPGSIARQLPAEAARVAAQTGSSDSFGSSGSGSMQPRLYVLMDRDAFVRAMQEDSRGWFQDMSATFARKNS